MTRKELLQVTNIQKNHTQTQRTPLILFENYSGKTTLLSLRRIQMGDLLS
jgi:hypothetical protein